MTFNQDKIDKFNEIINEAINIVLLCHSSPDADTIGSSLALQNVLLQNNKNAKVVCPNNIPPFIQWLDKCEDIVVFDNAEREATRLIREADLILAMDFNAPGRTGPIEKLLYESEAVKVLIDHHLMPDEEFFDLLFSVIEKSSTCELLFDILRQSEFEKNINLEIATSIFVGLMTDTGSFAYSCNSPESFYAAAELIKYGVNVKEKHDKVYNNNSPERLRILGYCINKKLKVFLDKKAAYISLSMGELKKFGNEDGLTEGIVNYALSIKGINFAALLTEKKDLVKISFRSKGDFSVNEFARKYFNGGGHYNAAGERFYKPLKETENYLEELIAEF